MLIEFQVKKGTPAAFMSRLKSGGLSKQEMEIVLGRGSNGTIHRAWVDSTGQRRVEIVLDRHKRRGKRPPAPKKGEKPRVWWNDKTGDPLTVDEKNALYGTPYITPDPYIYAYTNP